MSEQKLNLKETKLTSAEEKIHQQALSRAATYKKAHAELLESVMIVDQSKLYQKFCLTSTFAYCQTILRLSEDVTCTLIKLARVSQKVPELKIAIDDGTINISNARQIAAVMNQENKFEWLEKAKTLPQKKLQQEVAKQFPSEAIYEKSKYISANRVKLEMGVSDELMNLFKRAQDLVSQKKRKAVNLEETLQTILENFIEREDPLEKAKRAEEKIQAQPVPAQTQPQSALAFPFLSVARRGAMQKITVKPHRKPLPAAILHKLNRRDSRQCQARLPNGEICGSRRWTEYHHIRSVAAGGTNELENLLTLCASHHRQLHES